MKTYHYPLGHEAGKTFTVKELRAFLKNFPEDMPVFVEWEDCAVYLIPEAAQIKNGIHKGQPSESVPALVFDVNIY